MDVSAVEMNYHDYHYRYRYRNRYHYHYTGCDVVYLVSAIIKLISPKSLSPMYKTLKLNLPVFPQLHQ